MGKDIYCISKHSRVEKRNLIEVINLMQLKVAPDLFLSENIFGSWTEFLHFSVHFLPVNKLTTVNNLCNWPTAVWGLCIWMRIRFKAACSRTPAFHPSTMELLTWRMAWKTCSNWTLPSAPIMNPQQGRHMLPRQQITGHHHSLLLFFYGYEKKPEKLMLMKILANLQAGLR